jgi:hypothetical protein
MVTRRGRRVTTMGLGRRLVKPSENRPTCARSCVAQTHGPTRGRGAVVPSPKSEYRRYVTATCGDAPRGRPPFRQTVRLLLGSGR